MAGEPCTHGRLVIAAAPRLALERRHTWPVNLEACGRLVTAAAPRLALERPVTWPVNPGSHGRLVIAAAPRLALERGHTWPVSLARTARPARHRGCAAMAA